MEELIPDAKLRPFLTPTSGEIIPEGQNFTILCHNGITELILRCNLRDVFLDKDNESDKNTTVFDEDYEYDAHFALVNTDGGKVKAICSWGGFYDYYASQSEDEREKFHTNLELQKEIEEKYAGQAYLVDGEEAAGLFCSDILTDEEWNFDVTFDSDNQFIELITHPVSVQAKVWRYADEKQSGDKVRVSDRAPTPAAASAPHRSSARSEDRRLPFYPCLSVPERSHHYLLPTGTG